MHESPPPPAVTRPMQLSAYYLLTNVEWPTYVAHSDSCLVRRNVRCVEKTRTVRGDRLGLSLDRCFGPTS